MPTVRLVNGRRRKPKTYNMVGRKTNSGLTYVVNKSRRHKKRRASSAPRRRRRNPVTTMVRRRSNHRRRNPGGEMMSLLEQGLVVGLSGSLARSLPAMIMSDDQNSGAMGYGANLLTTAGLYFAAKAASSGETAKLVAIGGVGATIMRVVTEKFSSQIQSFTGVKLQGDPAFTFTRRRLAGAYANPYNFTIPFNSVPTDPAFSYAGILPPAPPVVAAPAPAKMGNDGLWSGLWS